MIGMRDKTLLKIVAILSITVLEIINLIFYKIDGVLLSSIIATIAGLAGYEIGTKKRNQEEIEG